MGTKARICLAALLLACACRREQAGSGKAKGVLSAALSSPPIASSAHAEPASSGHGSEPLLRELLSRWLEKA